MFPSYQVGSWGQIHGAGAPEKRGIFFEVVPQKSESTIYRHGLTPLLLQLERALGGRGATFPSAPQGDGW